MWATAEPIVNLGQKHVKLRTAEGDRKCRRMIVQVAPIRKALISTARLNDAGNDVNLHADRPHIIHKATGERTEPKRVGRAYTVDLWVWLSKDEGQDKRPAKKVPVSSRQR